MLVHNLQYAPRVFGVFHATPWKKNLKHRGRRGSVGNFVMLLFLLESKFSGPWCISVGFSVDLRASRWFAVAHGAISITYRL